MKHQKSTSSLLINESPLLVLPSLAVKAGLNEALILQQVHYWISNPKAGVEHEGRKWVWNTIKEWKEQFPFWSEKTISRAMHSAKQQGFLLCAKLSKDSWDKTMHYSLDYDALNSENTPKSLIHSIETDCSYRKGQIVRIEEDTLSVSKGTDCPYLYSTETSSEISSETTHKEAPPKPQPPAPKQPQQETTTASAFAVCVSESFNSLWESSPLPKVNKQKAAKAWEKACKGRPLEKIAEGMQLLAQDLAERAAYVDGYDSPFWKTHLSTYISREMWKDEDMPQRFDKVRGASDSVKGQLNEAQAHSRP